MSHLSCVIAAVVIHISTGENMMQIFVIVSTNYNYIKESISMTINLIDIDVVSEYNNQASTLCSTKENSHKIMTPSASPESR